MQASQTRQWWALGGRQMLQDLQYLTGTSMAVGGAEGSEEGDQDLTIVQSERLGPMARGSVSEASWG